MAWIILLGIISFIFGLLLILSPTTITGMSEKLNRMVNKIDEEVFKYRLGVGICLIIAAIFLFFMAYLMTIRR